jgi:HlyD family secretion protein
VNKPERLPSPGQLPELWDGAAPDEEEGRGGPNVQRALAYIGGFFCILFILAAVVPIGGAVIGLGQVGVESRVKRIAHPTGGVITEIAVANGEHVEEGELLMRLDDRVTGADAMYSSLTLEQLLAEQARLEAERLGAPSVRFPPQLTGAGTPGARRAMEDAQRLFAIRRSEEAQLRAQIAARIEQLNDEIAGYRAQISSLRRQLALIEPERRNVKELWDQQLVTISRLNQLERTAADLEGNIAALEAQIASTRGRITEAQEQAIQMRETRRSEAGQALNEVNTALNQQQVRSVAAGDQQDRSEIRAPYSGTIEKIAFAAVGEVVRPAEPIMEIVPDADRMVVEAMVAPEDIDQVRAGQNALVRFTSFNQAATPEIEGEVTYVAADRSEDPEAQQSFFMVRVEVDQAEVGRERLDLRSGMPAEVHIRTGDRSLLSYVFRPLRDQFARAFRDN